MGLARRFTWVHGYDISPGHLSHAAERAKEGGVMIILWPKNRMRYTKKPGPVRQKQNGTKIGSGMIANQA